MLTQDGCAYDMTTTCQTGHAMVFGQLGGVQYVVDRMNYQLEYVKRFADTPVEVGSVGSRWLVWKLTLRGLGTLERW